MTLALVAVPGGYYDANGGPDQDDVKILCDGDLHSGPDCIDWCVRADALVVSITYREDVDP